MVDCNITANYFAEKLRTENLTQGFECVGVSAI